MENQDKFNELFGAVKPKSKYSSSVFTVIYGDVGNGKTYLATTAQKLGKCVLINFENRISHIDETENLRIIPRSQGEFREDIACEYKTFTGFIKYVKDNNIKFDYLILDSIDEMFSKFLKGMLRSGEISDGFYGRAQVYDKMWETIKEIKDLGISIIATCHKKSSGDTGMKTDISLTDKLKDKVNMTIDNIFYLKKIDDKNRILILKAPEDMFATKLTTKPELYNDVVSEIQNPTWKTIVEAIKGNGAND